MDSHRWEYWLFSIIFEFFWIGMGVALAALTDGQLWLGGLVFGAAWALYALWHERKAESRIRKSETKDRETNE